MSLNMRLQLAFLLILLPAVLAQEDEDEDEAVLEFDVDGAVDNCMPLLQCEPLMYLLNAIRYDNIPEGFTRHQLVVQLRESQCEGSTRQAIRVNCPLSAAEVVGTQDALRGGITIARAATADKCEGSVRVHVMGPETGVHVHTIGGRRNNVARSPG